MRTAAGRGIAKVKWARKGLGNLMLICYHKTLALIYHKVGIDRESQSFFRLNLRIGQVDFAAEYFYEFRLGNKSVEGSIIALCRDKTVICTFPDTG